MLKLYKYPFYNKKLSGETPYAGCPRPHLSFHSGPTTMKIFQDGGLPVILAVDDNLLLF